MDPYCPATYPDSSVSYALLQIARSRTPATSAPSRTVALRSLLIQPLFLLPYISTVAYVCNDQRLYHGRKERKGKSNNECDVKIIENNSESSQRLVCITLDIFLDPGEAHKSSTFSLLSEEIGDKNNPA